MRILPDGRLRLEEGAQRLAVRGRSVLPIGADRIPAVAQALLIGVAVLGDDRRDPIRMLDREAEPGRRAVVEHVDRIAVEADRLGEAVDRLGNLVECIRLMRHVGIAKARQIGRDDMESIGELRDEVAEHVAGGREAMQQEQLRGALSARLAVEHVAAVDLGGAIMDGGHDASSFRFSNNVVAARRRDDARMGPGRPRRLAGYADSVLRLVSVTDLNAALCPAPHVSDPA